MTEPQQESTALRRRMPAEWETHRGTWISWPHKVESWPGAFETVPETVAWMVRQLSDGEEVHINVADIQMETDARTVLGRSRYRANNIFFHHNPTNDAWCRDHGPIFVSVGGKDDPIQQILNWGYNAWGDKYPPYDLDNQIPALIGAEYDIPVITPGMILEGGSIDVNGKGSLLTTEQCLLHPNRNPGLDRSQIEQLLREHLGVENILWLGEGIVGDDTDGHVDDITRFVAADTILTATEGDPSDANHQPLAENLERLQRMKDQDGKPFKIVTLPMPRAVTFEGHRLPASYANFYIGNEVVLMPGYDPESDENARSVLQECFPTRRVLVSDCSKLVWGLGAFHCLTQQWPS